MLTARVHSDALDCFLNTYGNSSKHLFDCSGVSIIKNLKSQLPISDDNSVCELTDQSWRPVSYHKPYTNWTYTTNGKSAIGSNGKVCVYSNGYSDLCHLYIIVTIVQYIIHVIGIISLELPLIQMRLLKALLVDFKIQITVELLVSDVFIA